MKEIYSPSGTYLLGIKQGTEDFLYHPVQFSEYTVLFLLEGDGIYHADFGAFPFAGPVLLFSTPLQLIRIEVTQPSPFTQLQFHGDFYCIEYHRAEVSCNGLLFNTIYIEPVVTLTSEEARVFTQLLEEMEKEIDYPTPSEIVLRAYLQLFLAKSSSIKLNPMGQAQVQRDELMEQFRQLLDEHYLTLHRPQEYADLLAISPNTLTKRSSRYFKKTPSQLIQERLILEAKKQLHLTRLSIKEIAYQLKFFDEFYFSRFFKKFTGVSPQTFRDRTGISIVADLSM